MSTSKQNRLTLKQKVEILKKLDNGVRANRLALEFGVSEAAISQIKKKKHEIFDACANSFQGGKKKTLHKPEYGEMETKLSKWFVDQRNKHVPINDVDMKAMALKLFAQVYPDKTNADFNASDGWFSKFKHRHGIRAIQNSPVYESDVNGDLEWDGYESVDEMDFSEYGDGTNADNTMLPTDESDWSDWNDEGNITAAKQSDMIDERDVVFSEPYYIESSTKRSRKDLDENTDAVQTSELGDDDDDDDDSESGADEDLVDSTNSRGERNSQMKRVAQLQKSVKYVRVPQTSIESKLRDRYSKSELKRTSTNQLRKIRRDFINTQCGEDIEVDFIPYNENISYEFYDDPNELCERLRLLIASRSAGNSNHSQKINSIVSELRERGIIN